MHWRYGADSRGSFSFPGPAFPLLQSQEDACPLAARYGAFRIGRLLGRKDRTNRWLGRSAVSGICGHLRLYAADVRVGLGNLGIAQTVKKADRPHMTCGTAGLFCIFRPDICKKTFDNPVKICYVYRVQGSDEDTPRRMMPREEPTWCNGSAFGDRLDTTSEPLTGNGQTGAPVKAPMSDGFQP